jgi:hypothetical protein
MTVHRKHGKRHEADFYATPPYVVAVGVKFAGELVEDTPKSILEPGSAAAAPFLAGLAPVFPKAKMVGIEYLGLKPNEKAHPGIIFDTDFMAWGATRTEKFDLIITNPPFSLALPFLQTGLELLAEGGLLVYLLRLSWFAGQKRFNLVHKTNPPIAARVLVERPSFTGKGTDSEEYAFFAYKRQNILGATEVDLVSWR